MSDVSPAYRHSMKRLHAKLYKQLKEAHSTCAEIQCALRFSDVGEESVRRTAECVANDLRSLISVGQSMAVNAEALNVQLCYRPTPEKGTP